MSKCQGALTLGTAVYDRLTKMGTVSITVSPVRQSIDAGAHRAVIGPLRRSKACFFTSSRRADTSSLTA